MIVPPPTDGVVGRRLRPGSPTLRHLLQHVRVIFKGFVNETGHCSWNPVKTARFLVPRQRAFELSHADVAAVRIVVDAARDYEASGLVLTAFELLFELDAVGCVETDTAFRRSEFVIDPHFVERSAVEPVAAGTVHESATVRFEHRLGTGFVDVDEVPIRRLGA